MSKSFLNYFYRFKWVHLSERVAYERAVRKHRMRVEISQAKKEAAYFSLKVNGSEKIKLHLDDENKISSDTSVNLPFPQKKTEEEYLKNKKTKIKNEDNLDVLKTLFS